MAKTLNIQEVINKIRSVPGSVRRSRDTTFEKVGKKIVDIMSRSGLSVRYPIEWDSLKQMRKVIAMLRDRGDLPYTRKGGYENAWEEKRIGGGHAVQNIGHNAIMLAGAPSGEFAGARAVQSSGQSHIHKNRWRLIKPVLDAINSRLGIDLLASLKIEINE
jgi:hypothetical protein